MASFAESLHAKLWFCTPEQLRQRRIVANQGVAHIEHIQDGRLTVEEETKLHMVMSDAIYSGVVRAYSQAPKYVAAAAGTPPFFETHTKHAAATAMMYYKMFFLEHSANEWDVWQIAFGAIYLASKTEEARLVDHPPRLEDFRPVLAQYRERGNVTLEEIEQSEINVLSVVGKTLTVHHPFKPILGMIGDVFKTYAGANPGTTIDAFGPICLKAIEFVGKALPHDVEFLFPPTAIALAALRLAVDASPDGPIKTAVSDYVNAIATKRNFQFETIFPFFQQRIGKNERSDAKELYDSKVQSYWNHKSNLLHRIANPHTATKDHVPGGGHFDRDANADAMDTSGV